MAHNLNTHNGKVSMFSAKEKPWHELGTLVDEAQTAEQAIKLANLDFIVEKRPLFLNEGKSLGEQAPAYATVRTDNNAILGVVGERYTPVQNIDAFSFFDELVERDEAIYETAGVLGNGERIWILAKLPSHIRIGNDDIVEKYVLIANSHDGSLAVTGQLTPIRVVCANTLSASLNLKETRVSIRHTSSAKERIETAYKILGLYDKRSKEIEELYNKIANKSASDNWVKDTLKKIVPDNPNAKNGTRADNIRNDMFHWYKNGIGQENIVGTKWGAYNGITGFIDHAKYNDKEKAFANSMFGAGQDVKVEALKLCLA
jgi:phage/plasmid-like protein (TIGR03299 family)